MIKPKDSEKRRAQLAAFGQLLDVLDELRVKCPWDAKQTYESLRPNTIEEVFELSDAILNRNEVEIRKELGDVLLHIAFYAKIGDENGSFDIKDVCQSLTEKLIYRHPHVFGNEQAECADDVSKNWEQLKLKEKGGNKSVMAGVPRSLPALIKSYRIQEKAANVGFDWEHKEDVWDKVYEELDELREEIENGGDREYAEGELGDFIFSMINMGRLYGLDPDTALERTNAKFMRRFAYIEEGAKRRGLQLKEMTLKQMEELYAEAKLLEKSSCSTSAK